MYLIYFLDFVSVSSGLILPVSNVSAMILDATEESFLDSSNPV